MDISGLIQTYDPRSASSAPLNRGLMTPQYNTQNHYDPASSSHLAAPQQNVQQSVQHEFNYNHYPGGQINVLVPAPTFANYIQQRPLPRPMQPQNEVNRGLPYTRNDRQGFVEEIPIQSPPIKNEPLWNTTESSPAFVASKINSKTITSTTPTDGSSEITFKTEVDNLMKAIQAKSQNNQPQKSSTMNQSTPVVGASRTPPYVPSCSQAEVQAFGQRNDFKLTHEDLQDGNRRSKDDKKKYHCTIENCTKSFHQKTHLDIHERAHTGHKPYHCQEAGCDRSFSQQGNLKTHQRRHTGERPFQCELCGKRFAQRGNVRAHRIVHDQAKPYLCRLDICGKQFTQLGNLKSHQNKFHAQTIRDLTSKFASIKDGDIVNAADKELWEYFANLYKNSNKGIKGRGKDRKVGTSSMSLNSGLRSLSMSGRAGYTMAGPGRGNMVVGLLDTEMNRHHGLKTEGQYEMFDADNESNSGSASSSGSSVATCYDDVPSDGFEDGGRGGNLAFGDRIY